MNNREFKEKIRFILKKKSKENIPNEPLNQIRDINYFSKHHNLMYYDSHCTELKHLDFHWPKRKYYLKKFLKEKSLFMDAGCGGGAIGRSFLKDFEKITNYVGVDKSKNIYKITRRGYRNAFAYKSLIENIKFKRNTFDLILCHGVLHHIQNYKKSLNKMIYVLKKNGILFLTVNKILPFILNLNTKDLKRKISLMPKKEGDKLIKNITFLGKSFRKVKGKVVINKDLKFLDIPKGKYDVQYLIHYYIFRNFYNPDWPLQASHNMNLDWYHPLISRNINIKEIESIFKKNNMKILKKYSPSPSADNYILQKK